MVRPGQSTGESPNHSVFIRGSNASRVNIDFVRLTVRKFDCSIARIFDSAASVAGLRVFRLNFLAQLRPRGSGLCRCAVRQILRCTATGFTLTSLSRDLETATRYIYGGLSVIRPEVRQEALETETGYLPEGRETSSAHVTFPSVRIRVAVVLVVVLVLVIVIVIVIAIIIIIVIIIIVVVVVIIILVIVIVIINHVVVVIKAAAAALAVATAALTFARIRMQIETRERCARDCRVRVASLL